MLRLTPVQANQLTDALLKQCPFFGAFDDMSICATNRITNLPQKNLLLADAIPAESYAAGRNPIQLWDVGGVYRNIDMVTLKNGVTQGVWTHSFVVVAPYVWVWRLYESIVKSTGGNQ